MRSRFIVFGTFMFLAVLVLAASNAPTDLVFNDNATVLFDEGSFSVNWTPGGGDAAANYSVYVFSNGSLYLVTINDSVTGYAFGNTTEANYTFIVGAVNVTGDEVNASNVSMYVDSSAPVFVNISNWSDTVGEDVVIFVNASDSLSGVDNYSINDTGNFSINGSQYLVNVSALGVGVYSLNVSVNDSVGNVGYEIITVTVSSVPVAATVPVVLLASRGGSGGVPSKDVVFGLQPQKVTYRVKHRFDVGGESHFLTLEKVNRVDGLVGLNIFSNVMTLELKVGEDEDVDVNGDGVLDITLMVDSIYDDELAVDLVVMKYGAEYVDVPVDDVDSSVVDGAVIKDVGERSFTWVWWVVVIVLIVIAWKKIVK